MCLILQFKENFLSPFFGSDLFSPGFKYIVIMWVQEHSILYTRNHVEKRMPFFLILITLAIFFFLEEAYWPTFGSMSIPVKWEPSLCDWQFHEVKEGESKEKKKCWTKIKSNSAASKLLLIAFKYIIRSHYLI